MTTDQARRDAAPAATSAAPGYTTTFLVSKPPAAAFAAVNDPRGWWDGQISGTTDRLGGEFTYRYSELHTSVQRVTELVPDRRVVWEVLSSRLGFVDEPEPWTGTRIVVDLRAEGEGTRVTLVHEGLVPALACFDRCSAGWDHVAGRSLRAFIETGRGVAF